MQRDGVTVEIRKPSHTLPSLKDEEELSDERLLVLVLLNIEMNPPQVYPRIVKFKNKIKFKKKKRLLVAFLATE